MEAAVRTRPIVIEKDVATMKAQMLQQRLLLLNHSSKCTVPNSEVCPVSRHCGQFKMLWTHILGCKDNGCKVMHCLSSRYVLSHYAKCDDFYCTICPRVRESAKRESTDSMDPPTSSAKKPRSSYWWASENFVNFSKAVTVTTKDFTRSNLPPHPPPNSSRSSPQITPAPSSVEKLNFNLTQLSLQSSFPTELPPRRSGVDFRAETPDRGDSRTETRAEVRVEARAEPRTEARSLSALDLLASAASSSTLMKPPTRPRASSGASTATAGSSYSDGGQPSLPSLPSISPSFHSSSSSSALFSNLQPAPFVSVAQHALHGTGHGTGTGSFSTASVAAGEECASNLSSFSSVCSYRESNNGSPYMTPQLSPVSSYKEESRLENKFKF